MSNRRSPLTAKAAYATRAGRKYYTGGNATRASVLQNPGAYTSPSDPLFGVKTFGRTGFMPSEEVRDAAAEAIITAGYSLTKNPVCQTCWTQKSRTGSCNCD